MDQARLSARIAELELQIRDFVANIAGDEGTTHGCTNGCTGSCPDPTGNCTYGCTNSCTNGCTDACNKHYQLREDQIHG